MSTEHREGIYQHPSDLIEIDMHESTDGEKITVGQAREFLGSKSAILHPFKLLKVARGLSEVLHEKVDFHGGLEVLTPNEIGRRASIAEEFLSMDPVEFPEEAQKDAS